MSKFVSQEGVIEIQMGNQPSRNGTPILELANLVKGNLVRITLNMFARTNEDGRSQGFYFNIQAINANEVRTLSPTGGLFQGTSGWQSVTKDVFFEVLNPSDSPAEDVDFEVLFSKGDISGTGQVRAFLLMGEVVSMQV